MKRIADTASAAPRPIRVAHLITDLEIGGTEVMLARLLEAFDSASVENIVISLKSGGELAQPISARGVQVTCLGMSSGRDTATGFARLRRVLRETKPDVLQTWLYHADLLGLAAGALVGVPAIVWNLRCSELDPRDYSRTLLRTLAALSRWPAAVVSNSEAGRRAHEQLGYRPRRWVLIPNGLDPDTCGPSAEARADFRRELGIPDDVPLVGLVARLHPMKDHETFVRAAAIVATRTADAHFVVAGRGVADSSALRALVGALGLDRRTHLLGERRDALRLLAALDVAVSASYSEGFPNVVLEAMACATPCVVTDAGDSAIIVGDTGLVVQSKDPQALAEAIVRLLEMDAHGRAALGLAARDRVIREYSLQRAMMRYHELYQGLSRSSVGYTEQPCAE